MSGQQLPPTLNRHVLPPPPHLCPIPSVLLYTARDTLYTVMLCQYWSSALVLFSHPQTLNSVNSVHTVNYVNSRAQLSTGTPPPSLNSVNSVNSVNYINSQVQISTGPPTPLEIGQFGQLCQFYNLAQHWSSPLEIGQIRLFGQLCQLLHFIPRLISLLRYLEI